MPEDKTTTQLIPLLIGPDYKHVVGTAEMLETDTATKVIFSVTAEGTDARDLVALMTTGEQVAFQLVAIPVTPRNTR